MNVPGAARSQWGFYQLEILVGITILLIVVAIVASYYKYNVKATRKSDSFYVSTQVAAAALEEVKSRISNPDSLGILLDRIVDSSHTRKSTMDRGGKTYAVTVRYTKVAGANLLRVKVSVQWDTVRRNALGTVYPYEP